MTKILDLQGFYVRRPKGVSVGPVSLSVMSGEILTIIGHSGVGKTSFALGALGYRSPSLEVGGERVYLGQGMQPATPLPHAVFIPQGSPFNPNWEVEKYLLRLPWKVESGGHVNRKEAVRSVLEILGIAHRRKAIVGELSGGERQRAALAQLFLMRPRLFVGDEFLSALDPGTILDVLDHLRSYLQTAQAGALVITHDVSMAVLSSNQVILLWPLNGEAVPVHFERASPFWSPEAIEAFLVLARWAGSEVHQEGIRVFLNAVQKVKPREDLPSWAEKLRPEARLDCLTQASREPTDASKSSSLTSVAVDRPILPVRRRVGERLFTGLAFRRRNGGWIAAGWYR